MRRTAGRHPWIDMIHAFAYKQESYYSAWAYTFYVNPYNAGNMSKRVQWTNIILLDSFLTMQDIPAERCTYHTIPREVEV